MKTILSETYFLSAGESNAEQEMSIPILVSKLIDIATAHANSLGIGNPSMTDINAGWVLSRLTIEMYSYPKVNSSYSISTWIEANNRHFSERNFKISDIEGNVYGYARSIWMVMDTLNHTNVGTSHLNIPDAFIIGNTPPIQRQARHFPIIESDSESTSNQALIATEPPFFYRFEYCDLDYYRHVNTVKYVNLLLNRFSLDQHDSTFIQRIELSFLHEAKYGMDVKLLRSDQHTPLKSVFQLSRVPDGEPILFARIFRSERV